MTRAAEAVVLSVMVWKITWGTVITVESTDSVEEYGMAVPDSEHCT